MICLLCTLPETQFDPNTGKHTDVKHPRDATGLICSNCMQILVTSSQEEIKRAYQLALDKRTPNKARALETFLKGEAAEDGETKNPNRDMDGAGALSKARIANHKVRPERTTRELDKRRIAVH